MDTALSVSKGRSPVLLLAAFVVGLALFAVAAIVRTVTADSGTRIEAVTAQGVASVGMANNVAGAFPVTTPTAFPAFVPTVEPIATTTTPPGSWLEYRQDGPARRVWADWWFPCLDLTMTGEYVGKDDAVRSAWDQLWDEDRAEVVAVCVGE